MFKSRESQMIFATEETTQRFMQEKKYKLIVTINMLIRAFKSCNTIVLSSELQNIEWRLFFRGLARDFYNFSQRFRRVDDHIFQTTPDKHFLVSSQ